METRQASPLQGLRVFRSAPDACCHTGLSFQQISPSQLPLLQQGSRATCQSGRGCDQWVWVWVRKCNFFFQKTCPPAPKPGPPAVHRVCCSTY